MTKELYTIVYTAPQAGSGIAYNCWGREPFIGDEYAARMLLEELQKSKFAKYENVVYEIYKLVKV